MENNTIKLLKAADTAELLDVSTDTLSRWRIQGIGPKFCKFHRGKQAIIRYRTSDLDEFISNALRSSTSDPGGHDE
jgi:hypothetical protein